MAISMDTFVFYGTVGKISNSKNELRTIAETEIPAEITGNAETLNTYIEYSKKLLDIVKAYTDLLEKDCNRFGIIHREVADLDNRLGRGFVGPQLPNQQSFGPQQRP